MADYDKLSDHELVSLLKQRDNAAYKEIYERYWPVLYRHARRMLQNESDVSDVIQDVFVVLWSKCEQLHLTVSLSSYLYAAVRNRILDLFKRNKVMDAHLDSLKNFPEQQADGADFLIREQELAAIIEQEIAFLPERMRAVFELKRKSNLSYKEIAVEMGISELTVKTQMNKAIKALKVKLGPYLFSSCFPFL